MYVKTSCLGQKKRVILATLRQAPKVAIIKLGRQTTSHQTLTKADLLLTQTSLLVFWFRPHSLLTFSTPHFLSSLSLELLLYRLSVFQNSQTFPFTPSVDCTGFLLQPAFSSKSVLVFIRSPNSAAYL